MQIGKKSKNEKHARHNEIGEKMRRLREQVEYLVIIKLFEL